MGETRRYYLLFCENGGSEKWAIKKIRKKDPIPQDAVMQGKLRKVKQFIFRFYLARAKRTYKKLKQK